MCWRSRCLTLIFFIFGAIKAPLADNLEEKAAGIKFQEVTNDLDEPIAIARNPWDPLKLFIGERSGAILLVDRQTGRLNTVVDLEELIGADSPRGLLGIVAAELHGQRNLVVSYLDPQGDLVVGRFILSDSPSVLDGDAMKVVIKIARLSVNPLGASLAIGQNGELFIGINDGQGEPRDRTETAQSLRTLLGKIIRIIPGAQTGYTVPADNPFRSQDAAQAEIWALGFRDPEALRIDPLSKELFALDSNQLNNELNQIVSKGNYGWALFDGDVCRVTGCSMPTDSIKPLLSIPKSSPTSHLIGGITYQGEGFKELTNSVIFAESGTNKIFAASKGSSQSWGYRVIAEAPQGEITALGDATGGGLFVGTNRGSIYELKR